MTAADVTVVIPTIPPRARMLGRALASVSAQTRPARTVVIEQDLDGAGAWETRNRGLLHVRTEWTAFLDDDDELLPHHLERLVELADDTGAGLVWGWFDVLGGFDPFPQHRGRTFDPDNPHIVPITYLVRTEALLAAVLETGGFAPDLAGAWDDQDAPVFVAAARLAGTANTPDVTWLWHHHRANTSGLPERWHPHPAARTAHNSPV
jgi:glycosyltransferase involved in cell wall biosynthesis